MNDTNFLPNNFYNSNTYSEQLSTFSPLPKLLEKVDNYNKKTAAFAGDFNLILGCNFDVSRGNPILKKKSLEKLIEIKEKLSICVIFGEQKILTIFCIDHLPMYFFYN